MAENIRVLIVDDHADFRAGLRAMLASAADLEVVGEATQGEEAVDLALRLQPDIVLMDLQMPGMNGIDATRRIVYTSPHVGVIMLTMFEDDNSVFAAMRAGRAAICSRGRSRPRFCMRCAGWPGARRSLGQGWRGA